MALTDIQVKSAKPKDKRFVLRDERGLYLEVAPSGGKWWRLRYSFGGKENRLSLGTYPDVSSSEARQKRDATRKLIAQGINPSEKRKHEKARSAKEYTFEFVAHEWAKRHVAIWSKEHAQLTLRRLELNIFPYIGAKPIDDITVSDLLECLRRIETRGALEVCHRVRSICSMVFRYAIVIGKGTVDPAETLKGAFALSRKTHYATITEPKRIGQLLRDIDNCKASQAVYCALRLAPFVFVRPGELRHAEWVEFDLENAEWRIPSEKIKTRKPHIVPLSKQAIAILKDLQALTGHGKYLFPSIRTDARLMSNNTLNVALRRIGYDSDEICSHGFREMASTLLNELGWSPDAIERQIAHSESNKVRAAYNHAEYLPERRKMMQAWSDYLDELRKKE